MKGKEQGHPRQMELIIAICNKGHTEDVMECARGAGAGGGTVLHAKGTAGSEYAEKFFGLSLVDEKEIIYIVSKKDAARLADVVKEKGFVLSEKTADIKGGFIVKNGDIEYNYSFESIITVEKEAIRQAAAEILF